MGLYGNAVPKTAENFRALWCARASLVLCLPCTLSVGASLPPPLTLPLAPGGAELPARPRRGLVARLILRAAIPQHRREGHRQEGQAAVVVRPKPTASVHPNPGRPSPRLGRCWSPRLASRPPAASSPAEAAPNPRNPQQELHLPPRHPLLHAAGAAARPAAGFKKNKPCPEVA